MSFLLSGRAGAISMADTVAKILHAKSGIGITRFVTPVIPSVFNPAVGHHIAFALLSVRSRHGISRRLPENGERTTGHECKLQAVAQRSFRAKKRILGTDAIPDPYASTRKERKNATTIWDNAKMPIYLSSFGAMFDVWL